MILKQRYQQLCDSLPAVPWCPDFHPPVRQMIFSLARDSSWEKGTATPQRPNLRRIPLHGIFAEDRVGNSTHFLKNLISTRVNAPFSPSMFVCFIIEI
jgi:hypothetical protein